MFNFHSFSTYIHTFRKYFTKKTNYHSYPMKKKSQMRPPKPTGQYLTARCDFLKQNISFRSAFRPIELTKAI